MKDGIKGKLDSIFEKHQNREQLIADKKREQKSAEDRFIDAFKVASAEVIKPVLDDLANYLLGQQQRSRVLINEKEGNSANGLQPQSVTIRLLFGDDHPYRTGNETAHLTLMADRAKQNVIIYENTMRPSRGGSAGSIGAFPLEAITPDLIQEKAAEWLGKVFG